MEYRIKALSEHEAINQHIGARDYDRMQWTSLKKQLGRIHAVFEFYEVEKGILKVNIGTVDKYLDDMTVPIGYHKQEMKSFLKEYHWSIGWLEPLDELSKIIKESTIH